MSKRLLLVLLVSALPLFGCGSDNAPQPVLVARPPAPPTTPPPTTPPPPLAADDVAGTWFTRIANNAVNCGLGEIVDAQALVITQDANDISVLTSTGVEFAGTVIGDLVEWTGDIDERGGTTTFTSLSLTALGTTAAGNAAWTWTDGTDSCNGTMEITAQQDWGVADGDRNSGPSLADPFAFTDNVAFFAGTVSSAVDLDFFSFTLAADATVQIELSHFDPATNDLDLQILNENFDIMQVSNSIDGFEIIEIDLLAGVTYTIGMTPVTTTGVVSYSLSVDMN
jgi:hypothetical protein